MGRLKELQGFPSSLLAYNGRKLLIGPTAHWSYSSMVLQLGFHLQISWMALQETAGTCPTSPMALRRGMWDPWLGAQGAISESYRVPPVLQLAYNARLWE